MDKRKFQHVDAVLKLLEAMTGDKRFGETIEELREGGHKMDVTMSTVLDLIEAKGERKGFDKGEKKGEEKGRIICYINCRKRNMPIKDAQGISGLNDELAEIAEKQYQKENTKTM